MYVAETRIGRGLRSTCAGMIGIFLFLTFFKNILKLTCIRFYFHGVTLLVTLDQVARQDSPITLADGGRSSKRGASWTRTCRATAYGATSLSRQAGWRDEADLTASPAFPLLSLLFPSSCPTPPPPVPPAACRPRSTPNRLIWEGK
jgi:hypothetical protein